MRNRLLALAASLALGVATVATAAVAAPQHMSGGNFSGGGRAGFSGSAGFSGGRAAFNGGSGFAGPRAGMSGNFGPARGNFAVNGAAVPNGTLSSRGVRGNFAANNWRSGNFAANNWRGDWRHGHRGRFFGPGVGIALGAFGTGYYDYYAPDYAYYDDSDSCFQRQLVPGPFGWRWRLVDVCQY